MASGRSTPFSGRAPALANAFVSISGLIGAGKSTLAVALGKELNLPVHFEPVAENVYLQDFYLDMKTYSFPMQIHLLNERFRQQQQILWAGCGAVQDRTIYEDTVFARMLTNAGFMEQRDLNTYLAIFDSLSKFMQKPDVIVHLDVMPAESLRRIQARNRDCEKGITLEYLTALRDAYEEFLTDISRFVPVIKVDWNQFQSTDKVVQHVACEFQRLHNIRHVTSSHFEGKFLSLSRSGSPAAADEAETCSPQPPVFTSSVNAIGVKRVSAMSLE